MKKEEILKNFVITKLDNDSVSIENNHFCFHYTVADSVMKKEFCGLYKYYGGLQCNYEEGTEGFKELEKILSEIAVKVLRF